MYSSLQASSASSTYVPSCKFKLVSNDDGQASSCTTNRQIQKLFALVSISEAIGNNIMDAEINKENERRDRVGF
jgi:hypothetical protein